MWGKPEFANSGEADFEALFKPTTWRVAQEMSQDALVGLGTYVGGSRLKEVEEAKKTGTPMSKEAFDATYKNYPSMKWTPDTTLESSAKLSLWHDSNKSYEEVIASARPYQKYLGYIPSLAISFSEPGTAAVGIAAELGVRGTAAIVAGVGARLATRPIAAGYMAVKAVKAAAQVGRVFSPAASIGQRLAVGAGIGTGAGVIQEYVGVPGFMLSTVEQARIAQADYDVVDSITNIATSAALGGVFEAAPAIMRQLKDKYRGRAKLVEAEKIDLAAVHMHRGEEINLSAVDAAHTNDILQNPNATVVDRVSILRSEIKEKTGIDILPSEPDLLKSPDVFLKESSFGELAQKLNPIVQTNFAEFLQKVDPFVKTDINWAELAQNKTLPINVQKELNKPSEYVVRDRKTGETIFKTNDKTLLDKVNSAKYETVPLVEHEANLQGRSLVPDGSRNDQAAKVANNAQKTFEQFTGTSNATTETVINKIFADNNAVIKNVETQEKIKWEGQLTFEQQAEELDSIYAFRKEHDQIMMMIERNEIDPIKAQTYLQEIDGYDPKSIDDAFLELQSCLMGA